MQAYNVSDMVPRRALKQCAEEHDTEAKRLAWLAAARTNAILGSCPKSLKSLISGLRCWFCFAQQELRLTGRELPPTVDGLLQFSVLFRCKGTFRNYVGYIRTACELVGFPIEAFMHNTINRAATAIDKRMFFRDVKCS